MIWYFTGVCIINRTVHGSWEIRSFSSRIKIYFTRSLRTLMNYFSTLEEKFRIFARSYIKYLYLFHYSRFTPNSPSPPPPPQPTNPSHSAFATCSIQVKSPTSKWESRIIISWKENDEIYESSSRTHR